MGIPNASAHTISTSCPQCGAVFDTGETCRDRFNTLQLKEIEQPAYYAVHHLSVPCYMLQHNGYSRQGWLAARELLRRFIDEGLTPEMARKQRISSFEPKKREWSITRGEKLPGIEKIHWTLTIAGVRNDTAGRYCVDVRRWAESILTDSRHMMGK